MERLVELRKKHDLTQQDMARILGISRQAYSNYELARAVDRRKDFACHPPLEPFRAGELGAED